MVRLMFMRVYYVIQDYITQEVVDRAILRMLVEMAYRLCCKLVRLSKNMKNNGALICPDLIITCQHRIDVLHK